MPKSPVVDFGVISKAQWPRKKNFSVCLYTEIFYYNNEWWILMFNGTIDEVLR